VSAAGPIRKLLIANRGEIARRIIRSARAMGLGTVAVYGDPDRTAPFVAEADRARGGTGLALRSPAASTEERAAPSLPGASS